MAVVENASSERRVWPGLQTTAGVTLGLDPQQTAEVELPDGFDDPHLRAVKAAKTGTPPSVPKKRPGDSGDV